MKFCQFTAWRQAVFVVESIPNSVSTLHCQAGQTMLNFSCLFRHCAIDQFVLLVSTWCNLSYLKYNSTGRKSLHLMRARQGERNQFVLTLNFWHSDANQGRKWPYIVNG